MSAEIVYNTIPSSLFLDQNIIRFYIPFSCSVHRKAEENVDRRRRRSGVNLARGLDGGGYP